MIRLGELKPARGATKRRKRVGRGAGSGHGSTSGRGNKGMLSRSGGRSKIAPWFEGGQMPLQRRLPKRGFRNPRRKIYQVVNLKDLQRVGDSVEKITPEVLIEKRIVKYRDIPIKILGEGEFTSKARVVANAFSNSAKEKINKAGGFVEIIKK